MYIVQARHLCGQQDCHLLLVNFCCTSLGQDVGKVFAITVSCNTLYSSMHVLRSQNRLHNLSLAAKRWPLRSLARIEIRVTNPDYLSRDRLSQKPRWTVTILLVNKICD